MPEELKEVGLTPDNAAPTAPEPETQDGAEKSSPFDSDPDLKGKSPEEVVRMYRDQKSFNGRLTNEVGEVRGLKDRLNYLEEAIRSAATMERPPVEPVKDEPQFDPITNPDAWFKAKWDKEMAKVRQLEQQRENARIQQEVITRYNRGKSDFFSDRSQAHLYEGIEQELENAMKGFVRQGVVKPMDLDDKRTWITAAKIMRVSRDEVDRLVQRKGMNAPDVETPGSRRQNESEVTLDDDVRRQVKQWGEYLGVNNEKDALEAMKYGMAGYESGDIQPRGRK